MAYSRSKSDVKPAYRWLGILEIGIQPKDYDAKYATPDEVNMVKQAISLWMKATIAQ